MDLIEKCTAAGIGNGSSYEDYPVVDGRVIRKVDGALKAFFNVELKPWESPREDTEFDASILVKIQAIEDGELYQLSQAEQDGIAAAEAAEAQKAEAPTPVELDKRLKAVEAAIAT